MKRRVEGISGAVSSKGVVIIVALIVAVAAIAVIFIIESNDNREIFDPEPHEHMVIGSTMTYDVVEGRSLLTTFDLEVVGTNAYNYALDVSPISAAFGLSMKYQTFDPITGELRFVEKYGTSTATIDGKRVNLRSYELTDSDELRWIFYVRADLESEIPVMIECVKDNVKIKAELKSTDIEYSESILYEEDPSHFFPTSTTDVLRGNVRIYTVTETSNVMMIGDDTLRVHRSLVTRTNASTGALISSISTVGYSLVPPL